MPVIHRLMKRLGFVKLSSFGLVLTPEGRVLSMRPAVLDDGLGGRIVGWEDGDLAAAELEKWEPARPAPRTMVATRGAAPVPPRPPVPTGQHRVVPTAASASVVIREASLPSSVAQVPTIKPPAPRVTAPAPAVNVAPQPPAEEDDWEWTIAIARARAAAEEVVQAAAAPPPAAPKPADEAMDSWPKTEQFDKDEQDEDDDYTKPDLDLARVVQRSAAQRVVLKATPPKPMPVVVPPQSALNAFARAKSPTTVIPVPKLPSVANPRPLNLVPVVRTEAPARRFAKGTDPLLPKTGELKVIPQNNEDTVPHMILPTAAQTVTLPSVMKRASRG